MNRPDEFRRDDLEALAAGRSFEELSAEERELALRECGTRDSYDHLRSVLLMARRELSAADPALLPRPAIRPELHAALRSRSRRPRFSIGLADLFAWKIPAYQAIAGAMAIAALVVLLRSGERPAQPRDRIVYVQAADTSLRNDEMEARLGRVVDSLRDELRRSRQAGEGTSRMAAVAMPRGARRRENIAAAPRITQPTRSAPPSDAPAWGNPESRNKYVGLDNLPGLDIQKRGRTLAEDSSLSSFTATSDGRRF